MQGAPLQPLCSLNRYYLRTFRAQGDRPFVRNKIALFYPVGALGFLLLTRFYLSYELFPDFTHNENWYDFHILLGVGTNTGNVER